MAYRYDPVSGEYYDDGLDEIDTSGVDTTAMPDSSGDFYTDGALQNALNSGLYGYDQSGQLQYIGPSDTNYIDEYQAMYSRDPATGEIVYTGPSDTTQLDEYLASQGMAPNQGFAGGSGGGGISLPSWLSGAFGGASNFIGENKGALGNLALGGAGLAGLTGILKDWGKPQVSSESATKTYARPAWYDEASQGALASAFNLQDPQAYKPYMNPYISEVLNPQITRMEEDFSRQQNVRDAQSAMRGAFGGSRNVLEGSLAQERLDKAKNEAVANAYSGAFGEAQKYALGTQGALTSTLGAVRPEASTEVTSTGTGPAADPWSRLAGLGGMLYGLTK